ncbi:MAG TPA: hypothetical protein VIF37_21095 [Methylobacter sp.]
MNSETRHLVEQLTVALVNLYDPGHWVLDVVEALDMPEKALEKDVLAARLLLHDVPEPVLKLLGDLPRIPSILSDITPKLKESAYQPSSFKQTCRLWPPTFLSST